MLFGPKRHFNAVGGGPPSMSAVPRHAPAPTASAEGALISRPCWPPYLLEISTNEARFSERSGGGPCPSSPEMGSRLSHTDARGQVRMVDVGAKPETARQAVATAAVKMAL